MSPTKTKLHLDPAAPMDLAAMTAYQDGAVVSRTLLDDPTGTLTVFSFAAGQALSEHTVPYNAFVQVLDGRAEITVGGKAVEVVAGQIVLMPGGVPHRVRAVERFKMLLILYKATTPS